MPTLIRAIIILISLNLSASAQELPPKPISIYANPAQGLIFGAFFQGPTGGSVIIYPDGSRSVTGSIIAANLGFSFSPAIFEVTANPGTLISILNGPDVMLNGSHGGSILLHIGSSSGGSPFIATATSPATTQVRIGGTLNMGSSLANPSGDYSGFFSITFIQE